MKASIHPKKHLGQHFLHDDHYCQKITSALDLTGPAPVLEIGPGTGALTRFLFPVLGDRYTGLEIDPRAINELRSKFGSGIRLIEGDFMDIPFTDWLPGTEKIQVVGNLPYYITTPILFRLMEVSERLGRTVIMIQREVAERMVSKPGSKEYGILSVRFQQAADLKLITRVPPGAFFPPPTVESAVLAIDWYTDPPLKPVSIRDFEITVRTAFHARRKTLRNNLQGLFRNPLPDLIDWSRRAETLTVKEFVTLSDYLTTHR